jgi:hypothetical protein
MDLKAITRQDKPADRLARAGMAICFLVTSGILLATLAAAKSAEQANNGAPGMAPLLKQLPRL